MKIIKLFLLLCIGLWADFKLDVPKLAEDAYNVAKGGWSEASSDLKRYFEENDIVFQNRVKKLANTPLKEQSDEEYIRESILEYSNSSFDFESMGFPPRATEEKYLKSLKATIKYDLKFPKYKRMLNTYDYPHIFAYIKFLEYKNRFDEAFFLYQMVMDRLKYVDTILAKKAINGINKLVINMSLKNALKESLEHSFYTKKQKQKLKKSVRKILMLDDTYYNGILLEEKREHLLYMRIAVIDVEKFDDFLQRNNIMFNEEIFDDLDRKTLKYFFENKDIMEKVLQSFNIKLEKLFKEIKAIKNKNEYLVLEKKYKKEVEIYGQQVNKKIGEGNKYILSNNEFIDLVGWAMFSYNRSWRIGAFKSDYLKTIEENKKFMKLF